MRFRRDSSVSYTNSSKNVRKRKNDTRNPSNDLPTTEKCLSKAESMIKLHLSGIYFMEEDEIRSYLIQLELITNLNHKEANRKSSIKYKLNRILQEYSQINREISQEATNSSFDLNLLTNTNFLSNSSSSDSGITLDIIPETQKFVSVSKYETRNKQTKIFFNEYARQSIEIKRRKTMENYQTTNSDTIISETIVPSYINEESHSEENLQQSHQTTFLAAKSFGNSVEILEVKESPSDAESIVFDIDNMEICMNNENSVIISNSDSLTERFKSNEIVRIVTVEDSCSVIPPTEFTEDIIAQTQASDASICNDSTKKEITLNKCRDLSDIQSNKTLKRRAKPLTIDRWLKYSTNQRARIGSRCNSLTNVSSNQLNSCIEDDNAISTSYATDSTKDSQGYSDIIAQTSYATDDTLNSETIERTCIKDTILLTDVDELTELNFTTKLGRFQNSNAIDNTKKIHCIEYLIIPPNTCKRGQKHSRKLSEDVFKKPSIKTQSFDRTKNISADNFKDLSNYTATIFSDNSKEVIDKTSNGVEISKIETTFQSYNEEQCDLRIFSTHALTDLTQKVLQGIMEAQKISRTFQINFIKGVEKYSEMNKHKIQENIKRVKIGKNNPFLSNKMLCEKSQVEASKNRNSIDKDIETITDMFADMFNKYIKLAELNTVEFYKKINPDSENV